ncbi:MAG: cyanophycinase, partial [Candidatus Obscuribacterales bacterium]|nr:cyanophycinase [Candidatus Obscuribacterales bacterium]
MSMKRFFVGRRGFSLGFTAVLFAPYKSADAAESANGGHSDQTPDFKGTLYPIGGAADFALKRFAELAGGSSGRIMIIPHSSSSPKETADDLANTFMSLGVKDTDVIMPGESKSLAKSSAVFMSGGDQNRMMRLLDKGVMEQMRAFLRDGNLVGGTSAGAAAVAKRMIAGGMGDGLPKSKSLLIADGLDLLPGYMVDTHVGARSRQDRLMVGLSMVPGVGGIGLDEDTAVEIKNGKATVHGVGVAHVYRRANDFKSDMPSTPEGKFASVQNMIYSIYPAGES